MPDEDPRRISDAEAERACDEGEELYDARDYQGAEPLFRRALQLDPKLGRAAYGLAGVLLRRWSSAAKDPAAATDTVEDLLDEALWAVRSARYFDAELTLMSLLTEVILVKERWPDLAEELCQTAIVSGGDQPFAIGRYAELLADLGRFDESAAEFEKALKLEPRMHMNLLNYGRLQLRKSPPNLVFAEFLFRKAIEAGPEHADGHYHLGDVLVASDETLPEAIQSLTRALELDPTHLKAREVLAEATQLFRRSSSDG